MSDERTTRIRDPLAFLPGIAEKLGNYVYALRDPRDGSLFYVGKGKGNRAYDHARRALRVDGNLTPKQLKLGRIKEIISDGQDVIVDIVRHGLDATAVLDVEAAAIDLANLISNNSLTNLVSGHHVERGWRPLSDLVPRYWAEPVTVAKEHRVILIRIKREFQHAMNEAALYEATRNWWKASPERRQPDWAFSVYDGIVRAVWRIDGWSTRADRRWEFTGRRDPQMEETYVWKDVSAYLRRGAQNPIAYVNCD